MSSEAIIRAWKDPDRDSGDGADHPAGRIELGADPAGGALTLLPCLASVTAITAAASCWASCPATAWDGSCNIASIGCCDTVAQ